MSIPSGRSAGGHIEGDYGNDIVVGNSGADGLKGGYGDDSLLGADGADRLQGDDGNDTEGDAARTRSSAGRAAIRLRAMPATT